MKKTGKILSLLLILLPAFVNCPASRDDDAARIHFLIGNIDILSSGKKVQPVVGGVLGKSDVIETAQKSSCDLLFADMMLVRIGEKSRAVVGKIKDEMNAALDISKGKIMVIFTRLGKESVLRVKGTTVTIAVRGTVFALGVEENRSAVSVLDGTVELELRGADARMKKVEIGPCGFAEITGEIIEDVLAGKKEVPVRKLSVAEKSLLIDELAAIQHESVGSLPPSLRAAFEDEIAKVMKQESAEQKKIREAEAALRRAEEARRKAELEALKKKQEEEERLKKEAEEAARRKKEAEEAEKKRLEEARKAAAKKAAQQKQKADRSTDTSGN